MGCDGGTIPRRDELVRQKKKPEQKDKSAENVARWKHCAITQDPLRKPIVSCELGRLYNKEAVLEHILSKDSSSETAGHITKLADVKELNLTEKNGFDSKKEPKGEGYVDICDSKYMCPVTGLTMNGKQRFCFMWKCGCVISERAIKEVKSESCHKCGSPVHANDIIIMNGTDDEISSLREKMTERRKLAKQQKKKKKAAATSTEEAPAEKKIKVEEEASTSGATNDKVENGVQANHNGKSVNSKYSTLPEKAKTTYSIAKDPKTSEAYKSLFTTHKNAKNQEKAHWVIHNPCFY